MKLAEDIWLGSVAARNNLIAAANYTAAFYGNAALQSWSLGLTAPQVFWSAMARAVDGQACAAIEPEAEGATPVLSVVAPEAVSQPEPETAPEPVAAEAATDAPAEAEAPEAVEVEAPAPLAAEAPEAAVAETPAPVAPDMPAASPLLLDAPRGGKPDDLTQVRGIGAKLAAGLNEFGIYHFDQIAGLDEAGIDWLEEHMPGFKRSCARYDLVRGAAELL